MAIPSGSTATVARTLALAIGLAPVTVAGCAAASVPPGATGAESSAPGAQAASAAPSGGRTTRPVPAASRRSAATQAKDARAAVAAACDRGVVEELKRIGSTLEIALYVTPGLTQVNRAAQWVDEHVGRYAAAAGPHVRYRRVSIETGEALDSAKALGLEPMAVAGEAVAVSLPSTVFGLVLSRGKDRELLPAVSVDSVRGLPFWLAAKVDALRTRSVGGRRFGFVVGIEGIALDDRDLLVPASTADDGPTLKRLFASALAPHQAVEVTLEQPIMPELEALIVPQPGRRLDEQELRRIDDFVMKGDKTLIVAASAVHPRDFDPAVPVSLEPTGLEPLLGAYGVAMETDAVLDKEAGLKIAVVLGNGQTEFFDMAIVPVVSNVEHGNRLATNQPPFVHIEGVAFPYASTLVPLPEKQPGARVAVLARSTDSAVAEREVRFSAFDARGNEEGLQRSLAVAVEGNIGSAFDARRARSRVLVLSSAHFFTNPLSRAGNGPPLSGQFRMFGGVGADQRLQVLSAQYARTYLTPMLLVTKNALDWGHVHPDVMNCAALLQYPPG